MFVVFSGAVVVAHVSLSRYRLHRRFCHRQNYRTPATKTPRSRAGADSSYSSCRSSVPEGIISSTYAEAAASDPFLVFFWLGSPSEVEAWVRLDIACRILLVDSSSAAPAPDSTLELPLFCWLPSRPPDTQSSLTSGNPWTLS